MIRAGIAMIGLLALGGCVADAPSTGQPSMYLNMADGAKLDPQAAASMISLYRQNNGLGAVVVDPELVRIAEVQSLAVENVSAGYHTLAEAFSGWRDSPPHRANMLQNGVTKLGIAASYAPNTKYKVFWTLILASTEPREQIGIPVPTG